MNNSLASLLSPVLILALGAATAAAQNSASVGFDAGNEGWSINGLNTITPSGGNPAEQLHWNDPVQTFGLSLRSSTHAAFLGDYTAKGEVTLSVDVKVGFILFSGAPAPRKLIIELFDDNSLGGAPPAAVWAQVALLEGTSLDWTSFSMTVTDVTSAALPAGWQGVNLATGVTELPPGRTWSNVLQGIDRIEFTTFEPGFFYGFTNFDVSIDNVSIQPLAPANAWTDQGSALAGVAGDPTLTGSGSLAAMTVNSVDLGNAAPSAALALFVGFASTPVPFKGGMLLPTPTLILPVASDGAGALALPFVMPPGAPSGSQLWVQAAIADGAAVNGVALSNAILGLTP